MDMSVIIPVRNDLPNLRRCLAALRGGTRKPGEIIVVDDASDEPLSLPDEDVRFVRLPRQSGPAAARNAGAGVARCRILVFLDADVFVKSDTLARAHSYFTEQDEKAVVGVFEDFRDYQSFYSDYKNLWMKFSYENCPARAALFYTSFAAIRAEVFAASGGFDVAYARPSTEDTAFGNRLWNMGIRPLMAPDLVVFHNKEYKLGSLLKTDFIRAGDLLKMKLRGDMGRLFDRTRTSVGHGTLLAVGIMMLAPPVLLVGHLTIAVLLVLFSTYCNHRYLAWLAKKRDAQFAVKSAVFMALDKLVVGAGLAYGFGAYVTGSKY